MSLPIPPDLITHSKSIEVHGTIDCSGRFRFDSNDDWGFWLEIHLGLHARHALYTENMTGSFHCDTCGRVARSRLSLTGKLDGGILHVTADQNLSNEDFTLTVDVNRLIQDPEYVRLRNGELDSSSDDEVDELDHS
jgi:hypothetical protein